jgi:hypothetical protein
VYKRGGLQSLARLLLGQLLGGQLPQLVVYKWQQLSGGVRVALLDGEQDARNLFSRIEMKSQALTRDAEKFPTGVSR